MLKNKQQEKTVRRNIWHHYRQSILR